MVDIGRNENDFESEEEEQADEIMFASSVRGSVHCRSTTEG